ncbi:putative type VII ESX secretion system EccE translocon [Kribbella pratensis]|uniref:Type VII ESX secretion system EccE translocon n=1 Tax=Kribbella pratensis TaxID=2512112 RepID=A0ABY2FHJ9_9ACTN|nr:type VII secretion protein EccE [Kribbella pratensis]TDW90416.1 putative type VII ESX secretion system EccE translocon [Kribbella pratensis]
MRSAAYRAAPQHEGEAQYAGTTTTLPQATAVGMPLAQPRVQQPPTRTLIASVGSVKPSEQKLQPAAEPPAPAPVADTVELPDRAVRVGQIICWQLAVVAVGAATTASRTVLILTSVAAVSLVLLTAVRIRGLWLYRWAGVLLVFLVRRRKHDLGEDIAVRLVSTFHGRTSTDQIVVREQRYGVLSRPFGASVALRIGPDSQHQLLPRLGQLAEASDEQPVGIGVQLILHTGVKQNQPPRAWIAVSAERTPDIATDEQLRQVLANTVRRLVRRLDREQVENMPLDESDALASLGALAHANAGRGQLQERWTSWSCGPVRQLSVRLAGSASLPVATTHALIGTLLGTGTGAAQTIAVTATSSSAHSTSARHDVVLRLAASHPATLDTAFSVLTTLARSFGVEPERLDGRHAAGVAATLPLGVPLS